MSLHPDVIDAMVAAGASTGMDPGAVLTLVQAACRAAWNIAPRKTGNLGEPAADRVLGTVNDRPGSPPSDATGAAACNDATLHATKRPKTSTERSRECRARARLAKASEVQRENVACNVAPAAPPSLSVVENIDSPREREGDMQRCNVASVARPPDLVPLPEDFQPDAKTRAVLNERLGEASAAVLTTNYCDHFWSHPEVLDTPGGWQSRLRKWARSERKQRDGPAQFALVRPMSGGRASVRVPSKPDDPLWAPVYEKLAAELGEAIAADWFRSVRFELCDGKATLQLPNPFLRQWIESHYDGQVSRAITAVHGAVKVNFSAQQRRESG